MILEGLRLRGGRIPHPTHSKKTEFVSMFRHAKGPNPALWPIYTPAKKVGKLDAPAICS